MEKREFLEKIEVQLTEYNVKLTELRGKAHQVQTDMRREYLSQVKLLEGKRDKLGESYGQLKESSVSAWEDVKKGTETALADVKEAFDKAINRFKF